MMPPTRSSLLVLLILTSSVAACASAPAQPDPGVGAARLVLQRAWIDEQGTRVALTDYRGAPFVLSAMYTSCTTRCPFTIDKLRNLDEAFRRRGVEARVVLVTLDPRTDTPDRLLRYKEAHHLPDHWHFLSGGDAETDAMARYLGVRLMRDDTHIDHDVRVAIFDSEGALVRRYAGWDFDVEEVVSAH